MAKQAVARKNKTSRADREAEAKRIAFANEFVKDLSGPAAAIAAGYSEATAPQAASRLLADPRVQALISERQAKISERTAITVDSIINELKKTAFATEPGIFEITASEKTAALVKIGQHIGMWRNLGPKVVVNNTFNTTVEMRHQAIDAEFKEILGSVDPIPLAAPAGTGSGAEVVSATAAQGRGKVRRARSQG